MSLAQDSLLTPISASELLDQEIRNRARFSRDGRVQRLRTGCEGIDSYVLGHGSGLGVERGIVVGVSAGSGIGDGCADCARLISLHLLADILLSQPKAGIGSPAVEIKPITKAVVIDTTGSFPVSVLAKILRSRVLASKETEGRTDFKNDDFLSNQNRGSSNIGGETLEEVQKYLRMVSISRVFDFEGASEVLREVEGESTARSLRSEQETNKEQALNTSADIMHNKKPKESPQQEVEPTPEILDSEEEASIDSGSPGIGPETTGLKGHMEREQNHFNTNFTDQNSDSDDDGIEMIVFDNMTNILNELFARKEKSEAHNLLTLFSRTLLSLSRTDNILTILHNTTTTSSSATTGPHTQSSKSAKSTYGSSQSQPQYQSSIFSSSPRPSLGKLFSSIVDLHVLISSHPKKRLDAAPPNDSGDPDTEDPSYAQSSVEHAYIFEILKDECPNLPSVVERDPEDDEGHKGFRRKGLGYREQRWAPFELADDGIRLIDIDIESVGIEKETS